MKKSSFAISYCTVFAQYYDYHLYGFLAANIAEYFFPSQEVTSKLINTYLIMALGMIAKPIGSGILGKIGDQRGRSVSFSISLMGTAAASLLLFLCPSFNSIGYLAIFTLLIARMIISACSSSGSDGVRIFVYENIAENRKCFGIGVATFFTQGGSLFGALVAYLVTLESLPENFWKLSFLLGFVISTAVLFLIKKIDIQEDEFLSKIKEENKKHLNSNDSLFIIIKENFRLFVTCLFLGGSIGSINQFVTIFFGTYSFQVLGLIDKSLMKIYVAIGVSIYMTCNLISGFLSDRIGRDKCIIFGLLMCIICSIIQSYYLSNNLISPTVYFITNASIPFIVIPGATIYKQSLPTNIRYRLFSFSHAVGSIIISAPTSYVCMNLFKFTKINAAPFCYFITALLVISFTLYCLGRKLNTK